MSATQPRQRKTVESTAKNGGTNNNNMNNDKTNGEKEISKTPSSPEAPAWVYLTILLLVVITYVAMPNPLQPHHGEEPTLQHVFYYGWLTAVSTGGGVIPLIFIPNLASYWVGISNAIAAGMMIAASYSLLLEGWLFDDPHDTSNWSCGIRTIIGTVVGIGFIAVTEKYLEKYEDLKVGGLGGADAKRALLIFFVMTLHSFSEGVGIGVSFGGIHGSELGVFISASLAVHNIPEGLAMAVALLPKGTPKATAVLWAILTSVPQPIMAVPAYIFVHHFIPLLPVGLGFAGGAMAWVAVFELLLESIEDCGILTTGVVSATSLFCMHFIQGVIDEGARS